MDNNNESNKNNNGDGSIRMRNDGRWEARIQIGTNADGSSIIKSLYGKSEREIKRKLREYKKSAMKEELDLNTVTMSAYIEDWLYCFKIGDIKPASFDRLESIYLNHIKDEIGYLQLSTITAKNIQELINQKSKTLSFSSVQKIKQLLNACFTHAVENGDVRKNPMKVVRVPKQNLMMVQTKEVEIYSDQEVDKLMKEIEYTFDKRKLFVYSPIWIFILNTGIRIGEALALNWSDINFENKSVKINKSLSHVRNREDTGNKKIDIITIPKTRAGNRMIPLNSEAIRSLEEIKKRNQLLGRKSEYVVCNQEGENQKLRNVQVAFERLCESARIDCRGIHALRHTFASKAIRSNVEIKVLSEILGHSKVSITYDIYVHVIDEQKVSAVNALEKLVLPG